jgi:hypothetical protein
MQSQNLNVLESMLQCLLRYITWVPIGYIFETQLLEMLVLKVSFVVAFFFGGILSGKN